MSTLEQRFLALCDARGVALPTDSGTDTKLFSLDDVLEIVRPADKRIANMQDTIARYTKAIKRPHTYRRKPF